MEHTCGNCGWWQGLEIPDCQEAECRARAPHMIQDSNCEPVTVWPKTNRNQLKCGAHEFKGQVNCPIEINPEPISPEAATKLFEDEWRRIKGSPPGESILRLFRNSIRSWVKS